MRFDSSNPVHRNDAAICLLAELALDGKITPEQMEQQIAVRYENVTSNPKFMTGWAQIGNSIDSDLDTQVLVKKNKLIDQIDRAIEDCRLSIDKDPDQLTEDEMITARHRAYKVAELVGTWLDIHRGVTI